MKLPRFLGSTLPRFIAIAGTIRPAIPTMNSPMTAIATPSGTLGRLVETTIISAENGATTRKTRSRPSRSASRPIRGEATTVSSPPKTYPNASRDSPIPAFFTM